MNNPFEYVPDAACEEAYRELVAGIEALRCSGRSDDVEFCCELDGGKMLGVLIASDTAGNRHTLYAFSGQIGGGFHRKGFVGPVFDYLCPDGYFKRMEAAISRQNSEISGFEKDCLVAVRAECDRVRMAVETELNECREAFRLTREERRRRRASGEVDAAEEADMIRRSQFEKAELRRMRQRLDARLEPYESALRRAQSRLREMKERRRAGSEALQQWLFTNFTLLNARGESRSLSDIFAGTTMRVPPSGAGECCAPKLLQAAYLNGWKPLSMAEYWYGRPNGGEVRENGMHYPACRGKCLPVLGWMLQGLSVEPPLDACGGDVAHRMPEILFENTHFCVVNKPGGMLSVPGKGSAISVQQWLEEKYGADRRVRMAHRLDRDTSGLLVATFGDEAYRVMQSLFATRKVQKTYVAILDGDYASRGIQQKGRISLPLSPDWLDRPRQRIDRDGGKEAVTDYEFTGVADGRSLVRFSPLTGRTHQLRVHAASGQGLGMPIAGDRLYGRNTGTQPLCLHARRVEFTFPIDGERYCFECPAPFGDGAL